MLFGANCSIRARNEVGEVIGWRNVFRLRLSSRLISGADGGRSLPQTLVSTPLGKDWIMVTYPRGVLHTSVA